MIEALAAILLQGVMRVPIATPMSISTPLERATISAPTIAGTTASSGQPTSEQTPDRENITVRRGARVTQESVPKPAGSK